AVARTLDEMASGARPRTAVLVGASKGASPWFIEPLARARDPLFVYGAGHVGRALVRALADLPFAIPWLDTATAPFPQALPAGVVTLPGDPAGLAAAAPAGALHVVMTYAHPLDLAVCASLLARGDFAYLGLIGSATKRQRFCRRLAALGIAASRLERLICPI